MSCFGNKYYFNYKSSKFPLDLDKLDKCVILGKNCDYLCLKENDTSHLTKILKTFPDILELHFSIKKCSEDLQEDITLPHLRELHISTPIPMNFKRIWNLFRNIEELTIGSCENQQIYTSSFINRLIAINRKSLKKIVFLDTPIEECSYQRPKIACQLDVLEIKSENSLKEISFSTKNNLITNLEPREILKTQNKLKSLKLEKVVVDNEILEAIRDSGLKRLTLTNIDFKWEVLATSAREMIESLEMLSLNNISKESSSFVQELLYNLKDIESLELSDLGRYFIRSPLKTRTSLQKLKDLKLEGNLVTKVVFENCNMCLFETLESLSCDISSITQLNTLLEICPKIKHLRIQVAEKEIVHFIIREFKFLESFEVTMPTYCEETVKLIMRKSDKIKRAKIFILNKFKSWFTPRMPSHEFKLAWHDYDLEINKDLDFKMSIYFLAFR